MSGYAGTSWHHRRFAGLLKKMYKGCDERSCFEGFWPIFFSVVSNKGPRP